MLLQLDGIGKQKIEYKDPSEIQFDSLSDYILLAKKSISKFANKFYNGLASKMLKDEDAISSVANAIMMADWRFNENREGSQGIKKTKYSYRNQCAIWAIQSYVTKSHKHNHKLEHSIYSLDHMLDSIEEGSLHHCIKDNKTESPETICIKKEDNNQLANIISDLMNCESLTDKQKEYIKLYYFDDHTFEQIGNKYGVTREAVRQSVNKALVSLRKAITNE